MLQCKVIYFLNCSKVDMNDNELGILELIHLFVEVLDGYFGNVCELDLVFHFDKARPVSRRCRTATVSLSFDFPEMGSLSGLYSLQLAIFAPQLPTNLTHGRSTGYWTSSFSPERSQKLLPVKS